MKDKCEWYTVYHQTAPYLWKVSVNNDTQSTIKQHPTYERCGRSGEELVGQRRCGRHDVEDLVQASEDVLVISKQSLWDGKHIYICMSAAELTSYVWQAVENILLHFSAYAAEVQGFSAQQCCHFWVYVYILCCAFRCLKNLTKFMSQPHTSIKKHPHPHPTLKEHILTLNQY